VAEVLQIAIGEQQQALANVPRDQALRAYSAAFFDRPRSLLEQTKLSLSEAELSVDVDVRRAISTFQQSTELAEASKKVVEQASKYFVDNKPANGQGYESAVAYALAAQLGFSKSQVTWAYEPFNSSYAPGPKKFDFDINEISYSAARAQVVTFSDSYYDVQQALVALKNSPIVTKHSPADLKSYVFGDQVGTTSLQFINSQIQPSQTPKVFETLNDVKQALQTKQIAALVTDTPTAEFITTEIPGSVVVAQFPSTGEHYGLLFAKGNQLVTCVNKALATLKGNGTLAKLTAQYLKDFTSVPTIQP